MERRSFIKAGCSLCVAVSVGLTVSAFYSCAPSIIYKTTISENKIAIPLLLFEKSNVIIIRAKNYEYDIAVRRTDDNNFMALLMRCTHADNQLTNTGNGFSCSLHGSIFEKDGSVRKGPAEDP